MKNTFQIATSNPKKLSVGRIHRNFCYDRLNLSHHTPYLKVGGAFHEPFVKHTKKMYGPNPKMFRVGPYMEIFRCDRLVFRTICSERIRTLRWGRGHTSVRVRRHCFFAPYCVRGCRVVFAIDGCDRFFFSFWKCPIFLPKFT